MNLRLACIILPLLLFISCRSNDLNDITIINANIINVSTGEIMHQNLSIKDGVITYLGNKKMEAEEIIDLKGKFIVPPFWDMHAHTHGDEKSLKEFTNYGVLGIRDMGTFSDSATYRLERYAKSKNKYYPEIHYAGRLHSDTTCSENHRHIKDIVDLKESIEYNINHGASYYKVHNCYPYKLMPKLDSMAIHKGLKIVGHIPEGLDPIDYVNNYNISSIEHISIPLRALSFRKNNAIDMHSGIDLMDGHYLDSLAHIMKENNVAFSPNLRSEYLFIKDYPEDKKHLGEALYKRYQKYVKRFSDAGVLLLASTDFGLEGLKAGISLHEELQLLSDTGISNLQVLQSTTLNPLIYLNRADNNLLKVGSGASFVILEENPLEDISNTETIYAIINRGKLIKIQ